MQDETHDQNQGMETPDTAPSRGRVIAIAILVYAMIACAGYFLFYQPSESIEQAAIDQEQPATKISGSSAYGKALYYAPNNSRLLIPEQIAFANLETADEIVSLSTGLGTYPEIDIIFIDPRQLARGDATLIRNQFDQGKVIVGLNTPHQILGEWLGVETTQADLTEDVTRNSVIWISVYYVDNGNTLEFVAAYEQFNGMLNAVHALKRP